MKIEHEECQYLNLIDRLLNEKVTRSNRTKVDTLSTFGYLQKYTLSNNTLPLITTKQMHTRAIIEELLWFISGSTDAKVLSEKGISIWNSNGSREYLDANGFTKREEGDLGPIYGFQWRHYGAEYIDCITNYSNKGIDQLQNAIDEIKNDPTSRRNIICAWNPVQLNEMTLPPCHCFVQFYVTNENELSSLLYQRSADVGIGMPFNITSYALLTHMIAHVVGMDCKELVYMTGDTHIYANQIEQLKEQITRTPNEFPKISFARKISNIDDFTYNDFVIKDYKCHSKIKMNMVI